MSNEGEITCESGQLSSKCKLSIRKGESRPNIDCPDKFSGPISAPVLLEVPFKGKKKKQKKTEHTKEKKLYRFKNCFKKNR